jgi:hypothetical protein
MPLTSTYAVQESVPAAAVRYMSVRTGLRATDGAGKSHGRARGSGYADHPPGFLPLTWRFKMPARYRHPLIAGSGPD